MKSLFLVTLWAIAAWIFLVSSPFTWEGLAGMSIAALFAVVGFLLSPRRENNQ